MAKNRKWFKNSPYGKYQVLKKIQQNPGSTAVEIADRHSRAMANIRDHIAEGFVVNEGDNSRGVLFITESGEEMLAWQDTNFCDEKQEYDRK